MENQCVRGWHHIHLLSAEQARFDVVEARDSARPRIDRGIQLRRKAAREDFRALPAYPGGNPGLFRAFEILGEDAFAQGLRARQALLDRCCQRRAIAFRR